MRWVGSGSGVVGFSFWYAECAKGRGGAEKRDRVKRFALTLWLMLGALIAVGCMIPVPRAEDRRQSIVLDDPQQLSLFNRIELDSGNGLFTLLYQKRQGFETAYRYGGSEELEWRARSAVWLIVDEDRRPIAMDQVVFDFASLIEAHEVGVGYEKVRLPKQDLEQIHQAMLEMETEDRYLEYFWDDGLLPVMMVFEE